MTSSNTRVMSYSQGLQYIMTSSDQAFFIQRLNFQELNSFKPLKSNEPLERQCRCLSFYSVRRKWNLRPTYIWDTYFPRGSWRRFLHVNALYIIWLSISWIKTFGCKTRCDFGSSNSLSGIRRHSIFGFP